MSVRAPHRRLTTVEITEVVVSAGQRTRLAQIHAHRLRHSAATAMLRAGAPLEEVGQVLRPDPRRPTADFSALRLKRRPQMAALGDMGEGSLAPDRERSRHGPRAG